MPPSLLRNVNPALLTGESVGPESMSDSGHVLVAQLGSEVASALSSALERVNALATSGKISRKSLRALRNELELARRVGIMGQQLTRLAAGKVRQSAECIDLTGTLRDVLQQHRREMESRGIEVHQALGPAKVMADPTLLFTLLHALVDWSAEHAKAPVEYRIDLTQWPVRAFLACSFWHVPQDRLDSLPGEVGPSKGLETMSWRLFEHVAAMMSLPLRVEDTPGRAHRVVEFSHTVNEPTLAHPEREDGDSLKVNSKPLAGSHLLVLAARRETRTLVRDAVRHMGLMVDFVTTVEECREFCQGGLPHAIAHEGSLGGDKFEQLRRELLADVPGLVFIAIAEQGKGYEARGRGRAYASVSRDALVEALPAALMFELSRQR